MITDIVVNVGDITVITCSGVHTYHKMITKHPDGGGEFIVVLHDGSPHPHTSEILVITHEELTSPDGYSVDHYISY